MDGTTQEHPRRAPAWVITIVLCLCGTVVSLQQTLVVPLLPDFPRILRTSPENASWLVTASLVMSAVATPIISKAADMYGKRLMMLICLAAMVTGSVIAALGDTLWVLLAGRALQGFAAALIPVGISILRDELPSERVAPAVALMSATLGIGGAIGTPLAGFIYANASWHVLFWVAAAAAAVFLVAIPLVVPESTVRASGRFDLPGAALLSLGLVALLLPISKGQAWGWTSELTLGLIAVSGLLFAAFVPLELRTSTPMVDLRTLVRRTVLLTNIASVCAGFAMFANLLATTQQLQMPTVTGYGLGLDVLSTGLWMLPTGLVMVVLAPVSSVITARFGARVALTSGLLVMAVGYLLRVFMYGSALQIIIGATIISSGTALAFAAMPTLIMRSVPITETAAANGLNSLLRAVGTSTSSAVTAAALTGATLVIGGVTLPALAAYQTIFWIAGGIAAAGAVVASFLPRAGLDNPITQAARAQAARGEHIVAGSFRSATGGRQGVATVLTLEGEQVDWARADNDGNFTIAVPAWGDYLLVASMDGYAPHSTLVSLTPETDGLTLTFDQRVILVGQISRSGRPVQGALVTVISRTGEVAGKALSDEQGRYEVPLPPAGRYVFTALCRSDGQVASRHLTLTGQPRVFNVDLDAVGDAGLVDAITGAQVLR